MSAQAARRMTNEVAAVPAKLTPENVKKLKRQELAARALELQALVDAREGELARMGDGALFVRRDAKGDLLRAYRAEMKLDERRNEIATIQQKPMITAQGAAKLNQVANLQIITPPTVVVDGTEQHNPYIERDPKTRAIQSVYIRRVAFGPSPTGNMVAVDGTLYFNIFTYFLQDLQAKIKKYPEAGTLGTRDREPKSYTYQGRRWDNRKKTYVADGKPREVKTDGKPMVFFQIEDPVGIWVDLSHPEIQAAFNEHVSRQKFGDRHARSICTRNVLLEHPAIATKNVQKRGNEATEVVYGWRRDESIKDIEEQARKIFEGEVGESEVHVLKTEAEVVPEDLQAAADTPDEFGDTVEAEAAVTAEDASPEQKAPPEEEEERKGGDADTERSRLLATVLEGSTIIGKERTLELLDKYFEGKNLEDLTNAQLTVLGRKVDEATDLENC